MFDKARSKGHVQLTMKRCELNFMAISALTVRVVFLPFSDDGRTKPVPRPADKVKMASKGQKAGSKPRSESTSSHNSDPEYNCLIRALYHSEKISTVVSLGFFLPLFTFQFFTSTCRCIKEMSTSSSWLIATS